MTDYSELESRLRDYRRTVQDCESDAFEAADAIKAQAARIAELETQVAEKYTPSSEISKVFPTAT